jgi:hypothetical protein
MPVGTIRVQIGKRQNLAAFCNTKWLSANNGDIEAAPDVELGWMFYHPKP